MDFKTAFNATKDALGVVKEETQQPDKIKLLDRFAQVLNDNSVKDIESLKTSLLNNNFGTSIAYPFGTLKSSCEFTMKVDWNGKTGEYDKEKTEEHHQIKAKGREACDHFLMELRR